MSDGIDFPLRTSFSPQSRKVAELLLIKSDLEDSIEIFQLWQKAQGGEKSLDRIRQSLFRDGVITLMACFDSASPEPLAAEDVYASHPGAMQFFNWLKDMRDTWIAHRFGPHRQAECVVAIDPETGDILAMGDVAMKFQGPQDDGSGRIIAFCEIALEHVKSIVENEKSLLKTELEALFPSQRKRLPKSRLKAPRPDHIRMGRRKFQNIHRHEKP